MAAAACGFAGCVMDPEAKPVDPLAPCNRCRDFDKECEGLDYVKCWLYDPGKGWCPFLMNGL